MDCREFEHCLDLLDTGLLPHERRREAVAHADSCVRCHGLLELLRCQEFALTTEDSEALTLAILQRTTGAVCPEAEERLCEYVDDALGQEDREIVSLHLGHCRRCDTLAATLCELEEVLPSLASLEPDSGFTAAVLRDTLAPAVAPSWSRMGVSLRAWWFRTMRRPRFAWEAAYVGALLVLLAFGNPVLMTAADEIPQALVERGDRLFDETSRAITERQTAARRSLGNLQLISEEVLRKTTAFQTQTTTAVRQGLSAFFTQVKSGFVGDDAAEPSRSAPR